jgi:general secretion pathway protein B
MSFILDALRKSEIERQRQSGPSIAEIPVAREDRRLPIALIAIGLLLAVNIGVLLFFLLRDGAAPDPAAAAPTVIANAPPPVSATAPADRKLSTPPPAEPMAYDAPPTGVDEPDDFYPSQTNPEPTMAPAAPDPTLLPEATAARPGGSVSYGDSPPVATSSLPTDPGAGLPALSVDLHIFTDEAAKRAVFINGRRYTRGATIAEGARVEEITRDGVVLSYRGRRFLLPRQ